MDCTYFQEMVLPVAMEDRGIPVVDGLNLRAPIQLQGCLHPQQQQQHQHQQMTSNYYCNPQFTFPAASWSTIDPTLLLAQSQQQELQEQLQQRSTISRSGTCFASVKSGGGGSSSNPDSAVGYVDPYTDCCGFSPMPSFDHTVAIGDHYLQNVGFIDSDDDHLGNLPLDAIGGMYNCNGAANERIPSHGADPYSVGASGLIMNPAESSLAPLQWSQQSCSLLASDQYCSDGLMPQLVSDYYSHSSEVHHQPTYCNNSSASVECGSGMHEADSCGNSERDRSTTSEEINWANSTINNSDQAMIQQPHSFDNLGCVAGRPTTGMMLPSPIGRREHTEEYSSTFVAAMGDKVEFAPNQTHIIAAHDLTQHHLGNSSISSMTTKYSGVRTAPVERASWMAPVSTTNSQVMGKTHVQNLDHLRMLGTSSAGQLANAVGSGSNCNDSLRLPPPASLNTFNYSQQQRACYTLDSIPLSTNTRPLSVMPSQNLRMNSGYPMAPLMEQRTVAEGATSNNLYKELLGGFTRTPLAGSGPAQAPKPILAAAQENSARGFGFRRDYGTGSDQPRLSSPCRKQAATSIEPQSVAARHRRKKISERVRLLEKLIPGGSKMDTASMFDEAIEYVKFLQLQVQLLEGMGEADKSPMEINTQLTAPTGTDAVAAECPTSSVASSTMTSAATSSSASRPSINLFNSGNSVSSRVNNNSHVAGVSSSFGSSVLSATLLQQSMLKPAGATPGAASNSPLILSEILQDQLFKQKLCLVSLHQYQYCPQQQPPAQPLVSSTRHGSR